MRTIKTTLEFIDHCRVYRPADGDHNNLQDKDLIYDGLCDYQVTVGGNMYRQGGQYYGEPVIFLPVIDVVFAVNDVVTIELHSGRKAWGMVEQWDVDNVDELQGTELWLKQMRDEQ